MKLLTLLTAATTASAFTVPPNLPSGIYSVAIDARGNALTSPKLIRSLSDLSTPSRITARQAPALPNPSTNCHNRQMSASRAEYDAALKAFNSVVCDPATMYQQGAAIWISQADAKTVPYMCNYEAANRCWTSESNEADALMNKQCGNTGIGWVFVAGYKKSYGRENVGQGGVLIFARWCLVFLGLSGEGRRCGVGDVIRKGVVRGKRGGDNSGPNS